MTFFLFNMIPKKLPLIIYRELLDLLTEGLGIYFNIHSDFVPLVLLVKNWNPALLVCSPTF